MTKTASIREFFGKALETRAELAAAHEALFNDLYNGEITLAEHRAIQKELTAKTKNFGARLKTLANWLDLELILRRQTVEASVSRS